MCGYCDLERSACSQEGDGRYVESPSAGSSRRFSAKAIAGEEKARLSPLSMKLN